MKINITSDAEEDLTVGFWFYEQQKAGLGDHFRSSVIADIESLKIFGGVHESSNKIHRKLCKKFPFTIYYRMNSENELTVIAVLDQRQNPAAIKGRLH